MIRHLKSGVSSQSLIQLALCLALVCALSLVWPSAAGAERRIALVIGNSSYDTGPLKNPVNDAADMAAALQKLGFTVILKKNANLQTMEEALEDFGNRLKRGGVGLFYYAGHGIQANGANYLIPVGAKIHKESDIRYKGLDAGRILDEMANANNGLNIVMLDACRDNPFARSFRSAARGLAIVSSAPTGTFISYSTGPGKVARDGDGRNSPYTKALIRHIKEPGLTINDVFIKVRQELRKETGQTPWELSSLEGNFYFVPPKGVRPAPVVQEEPTVRTDDLDTEQRKIDAETERLRKERELVEKKRALEEEKKRLEDARKKLAYVPAPDPARDAGYVRVINGKTTKVQFFESGYNHPDKKDRVYRSSFSRTQTRYVNWEIAFEYAPPGRRIDFKIESIWYANGSEIWRGLCDAYVLADWSNSYSAQGYGWANAGSNTWRSGNYRVDLYVEGTKIAVGNFTVY
jgi:uncharacterized caspase-like protein